MTKRCVWVDILAWGLIISSLIHIHSIAFQQGYDWYHHYYFDSGMMPLWLVNTRYCFSWFQRIMGLTAAVGLLRRKPWGRWIAIGIGVFTIVTIYWKHPYAAFHEHTQYLDEHFSYLLPRGSTVSFVDMTWAALIGHCILDIMFDSWMIFLLTRPNVKNEFSVK